MGIAVLIWMVLFVGAMIGMYITKDRQASVVELNNGDNIKITYLPPCRNGYGQPNPYIGMVGIVHDFNGKSFNLETKTSWLVCIDLKKCKFVKI